MELTTKRVIYFMALIINFIDLYIAEVVHDEIVHSTIDTSTRHSVSSTSSKNIDTNNPEENSNLIGGIEPAAFYSGISLVVLLIICVVLCGCLCNNKSDVSSTSTGNSCGDEKTLSTNTELSDVKVEHVNSNSSKCSPNPVLGNSLTVGETVSNECNQESNSLSDIKC